MIHQNPSSVGRLFDTLQDECVRKSNYHMKTAVCKILYWTYFIDIPKYESWVICYSEIREILSFILLNFIFLYSKAVGMEVDNNETFELDHYGMLHFVSFFCPNKLLTVAMSFVCIVLAFLNTCIYSFKLNMSQNVFTQNICMQSYFICCSAM